MVDSNSISTMRPVTSMEESPSSSASYSDFNQLSRSRKLSPLLEMSWLALLSRSLAELLCSGSELLGSSRSTEALEGALGDRCMIMLDGYEIKSK